MADQKIINIILHEIQNGKFSVSAHARTRMAERRITRDDIINIICTHFECTWQMDRGTYKIIGYLIDRDIGGVVATYRDGAIIVTVLDRRKGR